MTHRLKGISCDDCNKCERDMIEVYYASGNMHWCARCWPSHRPY
jgi:hypothetical protein